MALRSQTCKNVDMEMPKLNADSSEHYQTVLICRGYPSEEAGENSRRYRCGGINYRQVEIMRAVTDAAQ